MLTFKYVFIYNFVLLLKFSASKFPWISYCNNLEMKWACLTSAALEIRTSYLSSGGKHIQIIYLGKVTKQQGGKYSGQYSQFRTQAIKK